MFKTELYFGTGKPDGTHVTCFDFSEFLKNTVTPKFPEGLTVQESIGQWKSGTDVIKEHCYVLILIHEGLKVHNKLIDSIRNEYKILFQQESVLRIDIEPLQVSF